ncbi:hypothetical protein SCA6_010308 [Theobroma cacao]
MTAHADLWMSTNWEEKAKFFGLKRLQEEQLPWALQLILGCDMTAMKSVGELSTSNRSSDIGRTEMPGETEGTVW